MKSSTLHRAGLTREKMSLIENVKPKIMSNVHHLERHGRFQKKPELDVLWRDFEKSVQSKSKSKAPAVYVSIGFVLGLICAFVISFIVFAATYNDIKDKDFQQEKNIPIEVQHNSGKSSSSPVSISPSSTGEESSSEVQGLEDKYTVKSGDTLDRIAYRYYGKYDPDKIRKIMEVNNIKSETSLQIGQVLIIPLD